jgi:hypothetical protein
MYTISAYFQQEFVETRLFDLYDVSQEIRSYFNFDMLIYNSVLPLP